MNMIILPVVVTLFTLRVLFLSEIITKNLFEDNDQCIRPPTILNIIYFDYNFLLSFPLYMLHLENAPCRPIKMGE